MRRYGKKFLTLLVVFSIVFGGFPHSAKAAGMNDSASLYVYTEPFPNLMLEFVSENVGKYIAGMCENPNMSDFTGYTIGNPFSIYNSEIELYYFPIYYNGLLKYTFRVFYLDGKYDGVLSSALVDELKGLSRRSAAELPALFAAWNNSLYLLEGSSSTIVYREAGFSENKMGNISAENFITNSTLVTNCQTICSNVTNSSVQINNKLRSEYYPEAAFVYLNLVETQDSRPWCVAFCGAAVLSYLKNQTYYAEDIMRSIYPLETSAQRETHGLSLDLYVNYCNTLGYYPYNVSNSLSFGQVQDQIYDRDQPIMAYMSAGSGFVPHEIVIRGYISGQNLYSIWNPHFSYYETISASDAYITLDGTVYRWYGTVYNF